MDILLGLLATLVWWQWLLLSLIVITLAIMFASLALRLWFFWARIKAIRKYQKDHNGFREKG